MPLTVQPYPGALRNLGENLVEALGSLNEARAFADALADREAMLTGPFPVYVLDPEAIAAALEEPGAELFRQSGWRAPLSANNEAIALVEVTFGAEGEELYCVRDRAAASAFETLLRGALHYQEGDESFDVRWLSVPDIYVSALWLSGPRQLFVPTRLGSGERVDPQEMTWAELRERMLPLIAAARPNPELVDRDAGSPRSGLPR